MKRFFVRMTVAAALSLVPRAAATDLLYINTGNADYSATNAPMIDAYAFYNSGNFFVNTLLPFDFQNTLFFTNRGNMIGKVGFQFQRASTEEAPRWSDTFVNQRGGLIRADNTNYWAFIYSNVVIYPNYLTVAATNVINEGVMSAANAGQLKIQGKNVDLTRGTLEIRALNPDPTAGAFGTNFWPDSSIFDLWWGTGVQDPPANGPINTTTIVRFFGQDILATSPPHFVTDLYGGAGFARVSTFQAFQFAYTNVGGATFLTLTNADGTFTNLFVPTNIIRQAVLVGVNDTNNFEIRARFYPSPYPDVASRSATVQLRTVSTNSISGNREENNLYWTDRLASETNLALALNLGLFSQSATLRPVSYEVGRTTPFEYLLGAGPNSDVTKDFVYSTTFSNRLATNFYAGYSCLVDFMSTRAPPVPGMGPTDQPGRIEVEAETLNLTKTKFRGDGLVSVRTKHLVSSADASVDSPSLVYDLAATNGLLTVVNLAREDSKRLSGQMAAWSGLWTNQFALILSNWVVDPVAGTNLFSPITNAIDVSIHAFILSADFLTATQQVLVYDFRLHSTNMFVNDPILVGRQLVMEGEGLTVNGKLTLTNDLVDLRYTNYPGLKYFTNVGTVNVPNIAYYGSEEGTRPLRGFVNRGTLNAFTHNIAADFYDNSGTINSRNNLLVAANSAKFEGGRDLARADVRLSGNDLKLRAYTLQTEAALYLQFTNSIADVGGVNTNGVIVGDGFHLALKPRSGDFLGTVFHSIAPRNASVLHTWAGADRGATRAGFKDNAAVGRLVIRLQPGAEARFGPPRDALGQPLPGNHALYVDYLDLQDTMRADPEAYMGIEPNFTVYFATANVTAEDLDGKFNGRLRWVREFAGPFSGVDVALRDGRSIKANISLVDSRTIDSDGDGLANGYDDYPFDGPTLDAASGLKIVSRQPFTAVLTFDAAANTTYQVESATNLPALTWQSLGTVANSLGRVQSLSFTNVVTGGSPPGGPRQFYRVRRDL